MTGPARNSATADDEARWAEALALLEGTADDAARGRVRRARRVRLWLLLGVVLVATAVGAVVVLLLLDRRSLRTEHDPATLQIVLGFVLSAVGLVLMLVALVAQIRANRRINGFRSPVHVLSRRQRKELLAQVRGRAPAGSEHLPLARHVAEMVVLQPLAFATQAGLLVSQAGLWIAQPSTFRTWLVAVLTVSVVAFGLLAGREVGRARRFLEAHPVADA